MVVISPEKYDKSETEETIEISDEASFLKLYKLIEEGRWTDGMDFCTNNPVEASKWVVRNDKKNNILLRSLPLHEACARKADEDLIYSLLQAFPQGVQAKDHTGMLPLHHACLHGTSTRVVQKLLLMNPDAITVEDFSKETPLDYAKKSKSVHREAIINALSNGVSFWVWKGQHMKAMANREQGMNATVREDTRKTSDSNETRSKVFSDVCELTAKANVLESRLDGASVAKSNLEQNVSEVTNDIETLCQELQAKERSLEDFRAKCKEQKAELVESMRTQAELEKIYSAVLYEAASNQNINCKCEFESSLKTTIDDLSCKLHGLTGENSNLEKDIFSARKKCDDLSGKCSKSVTAEKELAANVRLLERKLAATKAAIENTKTVHEEQAAALNRERIELKDAAMKLKVETRHMEQKTDTNDNFVRKTTRNSDECFSKSAKRATELRAKLAEVKNRRVMLGQVCKKEKKELQSKIESLEQKVSDIDFEIASQQEKALQRLDYIQARLKDSAEEQVRMLTELVLKEKECITRIQI